MVRVGTRFKTRCRARVSDLIGMGRACHVRWTMRVCDYIDKHGEGARCSWRPSTLHRCRELVPRVGGTASGQDEVQDEMSSAHGRSSGHGRRMPRAVDHAGVRLHRCARGRREMQLATHTRSGLSQSRGQTARRCGHESRLHAPARSARCRMSIVRHIRHQLVVRETSVRHRCQNPS